MRVAKTEHQDVKAKETEVNCSNLNTLNSHTLRQGIVEDFKASIQRLLYLVLLNISNYSGSYQRTTQIKLKKLFSLKPQY